jgi:hypothetical protein
MARLRDRLRPDFQRLVSPQKAAMTKAMVGMIEEFADQVEAVAGLAARNQVTAGSETIMPRTV